MATEHGTEAADEWGNNWKPDPDYQITRAYHEKHFPEQNQRHETTPLPDPQGELGMSDQPTAPAETIVHTEWYREALRREAMSDHSNVEHARHNLKEAQREEKKHELDFWERRAQVGRTAHDAHIHAEKEAQKEEKTKLQQP